VLNPAPVARDPVPRELRPKGTMSGVLAGARPLNPVQRVA
jgi:hypothetical protein